MKRLAFRMLTAAVLSSWSINAPITKRTIVGESTRVPLLKTARAEPSAKFRSLPEDMMIRVKLIPQQAQRYDTEGDWQWHDDRLEIRLSKEVIEDDPRYGIVLLTHELVEAILCRSRGITDRQVDAFDMAFKGSGEPGDDPAAPYHGEHEAAQAAERALAVALNVDWRSYLGE